MTIPRRTDAANGEIKGMRLLAELPHVAAGPSSLQPAVSRQESGAAAPQFKSNHPAFAELNQFDEETVSSRQHSRDVRYVDQAHLDHEWDEHDDLGHYQRDQRRGRHVPQRQAISEQNSRHRHRRASGVGRLLSEAHEQMAPFAGLIVTAALMAFAGLLFLMMTGGKQDDANLDEFALPGFSVEAEGAPMPEEAPLADTQFAPELFEPEGLEHESVKPPTPESVPAVTAPANTSAATPQPVIEQITEPQEPLGQLSFPFTNTPLALDLSKAFAPANDGLQELPAVAERESPADTEPINR